MSYLEARACAKWWADCLRDPSDSPASEGLGAMDPGAALMTDVLAAKLRAREHDPEAVDRFEAELVRVFSERLGWGADVIFSRVNYHPDRDLQGAIDVAGLTSVEFAFPFKTTTSIVDGQVLLSCGYGAGDVVIYPVETEDKP